MKGYLSNLLDAVLFGAALGVAMGTLIVVAWGMVKLAGVWLA